MGWRDTKILLMHKKKKTMIGKLKEIYGKNWKNDRKGSKGKLINKKYKEDALK